MKYQLLIGLFMLVFGLQKTTAVETKYALDFELEIQLDTLDEDSCYVEIRGCTSGSILYALPFGEAPFTFEWSDGQGNQVIYPILDSLTEYCVTITDAVGCVAISCVDLNEDPSEDSCAVFISYFDSALHANGVGVSPFQYEWNTGETTESIFPTYTGWYCVTVTDSLGCTSSNCFHIFTNQDTLCDVVLAYNDSLIFADGWGEEPLTYEWSNGETGHTIENDGPGDYCVVVTDAVGCVARRCITIYDIQDTLCDVTLTYNDSLIFADGWGQEPLSYQWSNGETGHTIENDGPGDYCVVVTDAVGCVARDCITIYEDQDTLCDVTLTVVSDSADAKIITAHATGVAPFTYRWNTGEITQSIIANQTGSYCATIVDAEGCRAIACVRVYVQVDTLCDVTLAYNDSLIFADGWGQEPLTYEWNTGATGHTIDNPGPGTYCVTVTDAVGCVATACIDIPNNCNVYLDIDTLANGNFVIIANPLGEAPYTYLWNTGETGSTIYPVYAGIYCVTVTDATGCVARSCAQVTGVISPDSCYVSIVNQDSLLFADAQGEAPFTYEWSTGETGNTATYSGPAWYCVTVTSATACQASACKFIDNTNYRRLIRGSVIHYFDTTDINVNYEDLGKTVLTLYQLDEENIIEYGSIDLDQLPGYRNFSFEGIPDGDYIIKAEQEINTPYADQFVPSYHISEILWDEANIISIPRLNNYPNDNIVMVVNENRLTGGSGRITGNVDDPDGLLSNAENKSRADDPVEGASILLFNAFDQLVDYRVTDASGNFDFNELPLGRYKVMLELVGYEHAHFWVDLTADDPTKSGLQFELTDNGVTTDLEEIQDANILVFPNPVDQYLNVKLGDAWNGSSKIEIINIGGARMMEIDHFNSSEVLKINLSALNTGMYMYRISNGELVKTGKFVKK